MATTTTLPDCLHWSEGMLLSPQHLQQQEIYALAQLNYRLGSVVPFVHGVLRLAIDRTALARGLVRVTELECVLDDGHVVTYPGSYNERELTCNLPDFLAKGEPGPLKVWLVLPRRGIDQAGVPGAQRRYKLLPGAMTSDENIDNGFQVQVARMQAQIRLVAAATVPPQHAACALLEVERDAQGRFSLTSYHPPMLRAGASRFHDALAVGSSLQSRMEELCATLWAKLHALAAQRRDDAPDDYALLGEDGRRQLAMARHLAACLPQLEITVASGGARPEELYRALAFVVGQLAGFGSDPVPLQMAPYEHRDCMPQFDSALKFIQGKLNLVNTAWECLDFARLGEGRFARRLPGVLADELLVELKARDGQSLAELARWLDGAYIGAVELMPALQRRRLHGAPVRQLGAQEIVARQLHPNAALFSIRLDTIDLDGKSATPLFAPGSSLMIHGAGGNVAPAAIVLYQHRTTGAAAPAAASPRTGGTDEPMLAEGGLDG
jgi:type VI secretion system protein ImpJ